MRMIREIWNNLRKIQYEINIKVHPFIINVAHYIPEKERKTNYLISYSLIDVKSCIIFFFIVTYNQTKMDRVFMFRKDLNKKKNTTCLSRSMQLF